MTQHTHTLQVSTRGKGLYEFTQDARRWVTGCGVTTGLLTLFIRHTSASLTIQENLIFVFDPYDGQMILVIQLNSSTA